MLIKKIEFNQMKLIIELSKTCLPKTFISKQLPCVHASGEKRNFFLQRLHEKQNSYSYWNLSVSSYTHVWLCLLFSLQYPMLQMQQVWHMWANKDVQTHTHTHLHLGIMDDTNIFNKTYDDLISISKQFKPYQKNLIYAWIMTKAMVDSCV